MAKFGNYGSKNCCFKTDSRNLVTGELSRFSPPKIFFGDFVPKELYPVLHFTLQIGFPKIYLALLKTYTRESDIQ